MRQLEITGANVIITVSANMDKVEEAIQKMAGTCTLDSLVHDSWVLNIIFSGGTNVKTICVDARQHTGKDRYSYARRPDLVRIPLPPRL
jgi:hypothetical protein